MNKKLKLAVPFAVLALTCGVAAGCGGHKHDYSQWGHNETQHWKECPEDSEKEKGSVADHGAPNEEGKCPDCGYQLVTHEHSYTQWGSSMTHHWKECPDDGEMDASTRAPHGTPDADGKCPDCAYQILTYVDQSFKLSFRKDGATTPVTSLDGITITISKNGTTLTEGTDYTLEKGEDGVLTVKKIVSDTYTVTILTEDSEYRYSDTLKLDGGGQKEALMEFNYAIASSMSYYVDLTHMNDVDRYLAINTSSVDSFWQWNQPVAEITLNLADEIADSKNVKLEFKLKAEKPNNQPNNAFGIVMTESFKGASLSIWDTESETDGIRLHNLVGQKLAWDAYSADDAATLKWLEGAIYSADGVQLRVVRAGNTITFFANKDGKWVAFKSLACPEGDKTDIRFMGAGSDFVISEINVEGEYTAAPQNYSGTLTVLDGENKVVLAEGAKGLLIAGDTKYEVNLTKKEDGSYSFTGAFVPGMYTLSILGKVNSYSSAAVYVDGDPTADVTLTYGDYATATSHIGDGIQLADRVTITEGNIAIEGYHENGFWQWNIGQGNTVPAATLNLSDEIRYSRNVVLDFKLKATHPNNQPNNAFGVAMTEMHDGINMSFWNTEEHNIAYYALKGTYLGNNEFTPDNNTNHEWLKKAIYGNGAYFRVERNGKDIKFTARNGSEWVTIFEVECYEYADTMVKFLGIGSDYEISGIKVRVPKEGDVADLDIAATFEGESHGYSITVDPSVEEGGSATLIIETSDAELAWSYFPNAIKINGQLIDFSTVTVESLGANRVRYTLVIDNIMENQNIVVTVAKGEKVDCSATVNDETKGSLVLDSEEYYWNDACTLTLTAKEGFRLTGIVLGEETITEGWVKNGFEYVYTFKVTGDIKVNAVFEQTPKLAFDDVAIKVVDSADAAIVLEAGAKITLTGDYESELTLTANEDGTYSAAGSVYIGEYSFAISGLYLGYGKATVEITDGAAEVTFKLGDIASAMQYHHGDNHGMGAIDFETLVEADNNTVKINTAEANGKPVDAFWCWGSKVPEATLTISDEVKNATNVQLEFNLKAVGADADLGNDRHNNAFGIVMAGYKGVGLNWGQLKEEGLNVKEVSENKLAENGWGNGGHEFVWLEKLAYGEDGVNLRAIRNGAKITFFAEDADGNWVKIFATSCAADAKTDIKFLGMGSDYTVSAVKVALPKQAVALNITAEAEDSATITTDQKEYFLNEELTFTVAAAANHELKELVIGGTSITSGWKQDGNKYTYTLLVTGDSIEIVAKLEKTSVEVNLTVAGEGMTDDTLIKLTAKKDGTVTEFTKKEGVSQLIPGEYEVFVYGFKKDTLTVGADGGEVSVSLEKTIAYVSENDTKNEITVNETEKTITIAGNGLNDREPNQRKINAEFVISEEAKNATSLTLTFTAKAVKKENRGDFDWVGSRFGVQIGEGEIGFMVFPRNNVSGTASDVAQLIPGTNLALNPDKDGKTENKWHGDDSDLAWLAGSLFSENGTNFKVVRADGVIHIYAQNGEDWVQLDVKGTKGETATADDLTIGDTVKNQIIFTAGGDNWTFSDIAVEVKE